MLQSYEYNVLLLKKYLKKFGKKEKVLIFAARLKRKYPFCRHKFIDNIERLVQEASTETEKDRERRFLRDSQDIEIKKYNEEFDPGSG